MPHSYSGGFGGGGSSGGGGSHRGGGSGRSSGPRYSKNRYFPGAHRYYYINPVGVRCYFYYAGVPQRKTMASVLVPLIIALFVVVFITTVLLATMFPGKLGVSKCTYNGTLVDDPDDLFSETDEQNIKASLTAFYQKTGIEPYFYVFDANNMPELENDNYDYLEKYAYDKYLDIFDDEGHFLLVLAVPIDPNGKIKNWMCVEMLGNDTDRIFDESDFWKFKDSISRYLDSKEIPKAEAISKAYDESTQTVMKINPKDMFSMGLSLAVMVFMLVMIIYSCVKSVQQVKEFNAYCDYRDKNGGVDFIEGEESNSEAVENPSATSSEPFLTDTDTNVTDTATADTDTNDGTPATEPDSTASNTSSNGSDLFD